MKKNTVNTILIILIITISSVSVSTSTLCGGTLMQNWSGHGACTGFNDRFMGVIHGCLVLLTPVDTIGAIILSMTLLVLLPVLYFLNLSFASRKRRNKREK